MPNSQWANDWTVGVPVLIERRGQNVVGESQAKLLAAIGLHRSITKAAKAVGISYRKAWSVIQEVNAAAGAPLVTAAVGGVNGGGAELTDRGTFALKVFDEVRRLLHETAAGALQRAVTPDVATSSCIHLAAAISLQEVIGEVLAEFALRKPTVRVRAIFGASDELADHVLTGAPCDVFISAERGEIDRLRGAKMLVPNTQRTIASNNLALIARPSSKPFQKIEDLLAGRIKKVAVAEPSCPLGRYSMKYLESAGVYRALQQKVIYVDNSRAVPAAVIGKAADVGLAFASDAAVSNRVTIVFRIPEPLAAAKYVAAMTRKGRQQKEVKSLFEFLCSADVAQCLRRYGFRPIEN